MTSFYCDLYTIFSTIAIDFLFCRFWTFLYVSHVSPVPCIFEPHFPRVDRIIVYVRLNCSLYLSVVLDRRISMLWSIFRERGKEFTKMTESLITEWLTDCADVSSTDLHTCATTLVQDNEIVRALYVLLEERSKYSEVMHHFYITFFFLFNVQFFLLPAILGTKFVKFDLEFVVWALAKISPKISKNWSENLSFTTNLSNFAFQKRFLSITLKMYEKLQFFELISPVYFNDFF